MRRQNVCIICRLPQQLTNYKKDISGIVIAAMLITFISIVGSYYLQLIIDRFIPSKNINGLTILAGSLLVVYVFNSLFNYLRDVLLTRLDQKLTSQISLRYIHDAIFLHKKNGRNYFTV